jgi:hypothetical protein
VISPEKQAVSYAGKRLPLENGMKAQSTTVGSWRPGNECDFRRELTKLFSRKGFVADIHPITYYKVVISPEKQAVSYAGKRLPLENGMKAQSTLFLEKRKIYQWMLSPFYDMKRP